MGEPLNETGQFGDGLIVRGRHFVILDNFMNSTIYHRVLGQYNYMRKSVYVGKVRDKLVAYSLV